MLKKTQYQKTVRRPYPPLFASIILHGIATGEHYTPFLDEPFVMKDHIWSDAIAYYSCREYKTAGDLAFRAWTAPKKFQKARKIFMDREKRLIAKAAHGTFIQYADSYESYTPAIILPLCSEEPVESTLRRLLREKIGARKATMLMDVLNIPYQDNFYKKEEYELVTTTNLAAHVKKYEWITSRYGELHPYTLAQARSKRATIEKAQFLAKRRAEKRELKHAIADAKRALGAFEAHLVDVMQWIIYYRTQRSDTINRSQYLFAPKLKKLGATKGLVYKEILYCTKEEVLDKLPDSTIINSRMKNYAMILENGKVRCVAGKEADRIREFLRQDASALTSITGTTACRGTAQGIARIIQNRNDFTKMQSRDILVTSMTTTEMLPIMKKAAAIVTDEGGITSHAAIISRELKIPCIIGTRLATSVFKDGDIVEVDADKGMVKKLS